MSDEARKLENKRLAEELGGRTIQDMVEEYFTEIRKALDNDDMIYTERLALISAASTMALSILMELPPSEIYSKSAVMAKIAEHDAVVITGLRGLFDSNDA